MAHQYAQSAYLKVKSCEWCKENPFPKKKIVVPFRIYTSLVFLLQEVETEFLLYFYAEEREDGSWIATDIYLPEQEVTNTSCLALEQVLDVQGVFHSHQNMATFMSNTDDTHINANHHFSIVGNKKNEFKGITREFLPCGGITYVDAELILLDEDEYYQLSSQIKDKIKKKVAQPTTTVSYQKTPASTSATKETKPENPNPTAGAVNTKEEDMDEGLFKRTS